MTKKPLVIKNGKPTEISSSDTIPLSNIPPLSTSNIAGLGDFIYASLLGSDTISLSFNAGTDVTTINAITQLSLTSDSSGIKLVNDELSPGNEYYYGTDSGGVKGYFPLPTGADGNGIYSGSGNVSSDTIATVVAPSKFTIGTFTDLSSPLDYSEVGLFIDPAGSFISITTVLKGPAANYLYFDSNGDYTLRGTGPGSNSFVNSVSGSLEFLVNDSTGKIIKIGSSGVGLNFVKLYNKYFLPNATPSISNGVIQHMVWTGDGVNSIPSFATYTTPSSIYTGSGTVNYGTLATVTPDPLGTGGDFAIGYFPSWPSIPLNATGKGFYLAENLYGETGLIYNGNGLYAGSSGVAAVGGGKRLSINSLGVRLNNGPYLQTGAGSPEGVVTATPGSLYLNTSGGASVSLYVKESGAGNTGWVPK